jgi:hypothetical protein
VAWEVGKIILECDEKCPGIAFLRPSQFHIDGKIKQFYDGFCRCVKNKGVKYSSGKGG